MIQVVIDGTAEIYADIPHELKGVDAMVISCEDPAFH
jgi:hypothetical protein